MPRPTLGGMQLWSDVRWREGWRVQRNALSGVHRLLDPRDREHRSGTLAECEDALSRVEAGPVDHLVVVLHGLGRSRRSMRAMSRALSEDGLTVAPLDYASTRGPIDAHAEDVAALIAAVDPRRVSFVTHSLGGLVARAALPRIERAHRLVMCAPPSRGASLARLLSTRASPVAGAIFGPPLRELSEAPPIPVPDIPFAIVAGARGARVNPLLEGPDDGIVTVDETKLDGMREHVVVDAIHTFVMQHPEAIATARRFLADGEDQKPGSV